MDWAAFVAQCIPAPATIQVEAWQGSGAYGDVYGLPVAVTPCVVEDTRRLVRVQTQDAAGAEQISSSTVYAPLTTTAPPGSRITLPGPAGPAVLVTDTFGRIVANGWGNANTGQPWTAEGGVPANFSVSDVGLHSVGALLSSRRTLIGSGLIDTSQVVSVSVPELTSGVGAQQPMVAARYADNDNCYLFTVFFQPDRSVTVSVQRRLGGAQSALSGSVAVPGLVHQAGVPVRVRAEVVGTSLRMRVWQADQPEPAGWQMEVTDTAMTTGRCGLRSILDAGNTNTLPVSFSYDDYELQVFGALPGRVAKVLAVSRIEAAGWDLPEHLEISLE